MMCERCGKNPANTYLKQVINGNVREMHLCENCAQELGYSVLSTMNPFDMGISFNNFLGGLFSQALPQQTAGSTKTCPSCGSTFEDFMQNAQAGCANCYQAFYEELLPSIQRIHGKTKHVGKIPGSASKSLKLNRELTSLRQQLSAAVEAQEYEKAAKLRDRIREIEKEVNG